MSAQNFYALCHDVGVHDAAWLAHELGVTLAQVQLWRRTRKLVR